MHNHSPNAALVLSDGNVFFGFGIGKQGAAIGEVCFNTAITGYQEILTDPSYTSQIVTFTFPHIGNVGCNDEDNESGVRVGQTERSDPRGGDGGAGVGEAFPPNSHGAAGLIIREPITNPSNFRSQNNLNNWLINKGISGISGIDTRALTRHIRANGAQNAVILPFTSGKESEAVAEARSMLAKAPSMKGMELAATVTTDAPYEWSEGLWSLETSPSGRGRHEVSGEGHTPISPSPLPSPKGRGGRETFPTKNYHVVAVDYGAKLNILRNLVSHDCRITVVSAKTSAEEILALKPDGIFLSNGPGDPAATGEYALPIIKKLIASGLPIFGICLGHQLLGIALGGKTEKMKQGHRGANHPVKDLKTGKVEITSQNHGFAVAHGSLPDDVEVTHISLFDVTIQGLAHKTKPIFCVQGHPEASPGPHDSQYLFAQFIENIKNAKKK
jgi:carbamoyl-phosphate synthase small subunit